MAAGFTTIAIKDANGATQNLAVYQDAGGTFYPAPTGTDALGHILGLAATPIDSNLYVGGTAIALGSAVSASSMPVVIASDQAALPLPTGASTSALQTTGNTSLSTLAGAVTSSKMQANIAQIGGSALALGTTTAALSIPVTQSSPFSAAATQFARPANTTTYTIGWCLANSTTAGSVTPLQFAIAPANGVPVYITGGQLLVQTAGAAGIAITANGSFRLHLFNALPTVGAGDGATFSTTMVNWCGSLDGSLFQQGTDYTVANLTPSPGMGGAFIAQPAGGSTTIYGLIQVLSAFVPTSGELFTASIWRA